MGRKSHIWADAAILAACVLLFLAARLAVEPLLQAWQAPAIARGHLVDLVGGAAFMAYTNLLFDLLRPDKRIDSLLLTIPYMFACGLFWEFAAPFFIKASVSDWLDVASYVLGGIAYCLVVGNAERRRGSGTGGNKGPRRAPRNS